MKMELTSFHGPTKGSSTLTRFYLTGERLGISSNSITPMTTWITKQDDEKNELKFQRRKAGGGEDLR